MVWFEGARAGAHQARHHRQSYPGWPPGVSAPSTAPMPSPPIPQPLRWSSASSPGRSRCRPSASCIALSRSWLPAMGAEASACEAQPGVAPGSALCPQVRWQCSAIPPAPSRAARCPPTPSHAPLEAIKSHQKPSEASRSYQQPPPAISSHQQPSAAISSHQQPSEAISSHQGPSRNHQQQSVAVPLRLITERPDMALDARPVHIALRAAEGAPSPSNVSETRRVLHASMGASSPSSLPVNKREGREGRGL